MIGENEIKKEEKKIDSKVWIGIIVIAILLIAIILIIFIPKSNKTGEIVLSENIKSIYVSEKKDIIAKVSNYSDAVLKYQSSDEKILKIEENVMEGISAGKSRITITCNIDGVDSLSFDVEVIDGGGIISEVSFPKGELVIGVNKEFNLNDSLIINPSNGKFNSKVFISSNPNVASINESGLLKARSVGMTNISTNINNHFNSTITVFVVDDNNEGEIITNADKIVFKEDVLKINVNDVKSIEYDVYPKDASMAYVKVSCSDTKVVSIDDDGNIQGLKLGKADIIYKTIDKKEYKLKVEVVDEVISVEEIKVSQENVTMDLGTSKEIVFNVIPSTAINDEIDFTISDSSILDASIQNNTLIINSKNIGNASIILKSSNGIEKTIKVNVVNNNEVTPTPAETPILDIE